ncbi:nitrate/nitrite transporter [Massilia sp. CF038]|uniref:MFS transporter n=1 Tax=Massilia sp. CF038 TaxID=1881045 RepID=UPI000918D05C|nr:MFS transporter [Massilia sp. CF038]SHH50826.1 Predicted arabinose efflux permease, MFS family [Massilia sp. CF038]
MRGSQVFMTVFLPFALGHFLSSLLRTVNAVLAPELVLALGLSAGQLGLLSSALFLAFALAQLPVGIALDRYGPRRVQLVLLVVVAAGALLFAHGASFPQLVAARAVIGLGLGGCFMSAVKAVSAHIAPAKLPSVHGYMIAVGGLGAASATLPVRLVLEFTNWRGLYTMLAAFALCCALFIALAAPRAHATASGAAPFASVRAVYRDPAFRRIASLMLVPHAVFFGVQGLWIGRWLADVAHFGDAAVAWLLYLSMAALIFGAIAVGMLTEWAGRHGVTPLEVGAIGVALFVLVQMLAMLNYVPSLALLAVLFTLVGSITGLEYAIVAQSMPAALTGRASTCLNLLIFVGAFLVQAGVGLLLGMWRPDFAGHYPALAYRIAFGVLVLLQLPGLIAFVLARHRPFSWFSHPKNSST